MAQCIRVWYPRRVIRLHGTRLWKKLCVGRESFQKCIKWRVDSGKRLYFTMVSPSA